MIYVKIVEQHSRRTRCEISQALKETVESTAVALNWNLEVNCEMHTTHFPSRMGLGCVYIAFGTLVSHNACVRL